jgi:antitoxin YefM
MTSATYSHARENLATLWDQVEDTREEIILRRRGHEDVAILPASELRSLQETAHLLRSPGNAVRLLRALTRSRKGGASEEFASIDDLARELGLSR